MEKMLVPVYIHALPRVDGWGHPYEFYLSEDVMAPSVMLIRSPGRDGTFSGSRYEVGEFGAQDFDQDIVWSDGYFARWPAKAATQ